MQKDCTSLKVVLNDSTTFTQVFKVAGTAVSAVSNVVIRGPSTPQASQGAKATNLVNKTKQKLQLLFRLHMVSHIL